MPQVDIHAPGVEVKKSCCYFCHQNCGVLAYVKDGRVIKIEGDPDHPTNTGGLCCRGNIALKHLDHPARINHPLKRVGKKGANQWEKIPWDQAIQEIAAKLNQIRQESGAEAVATAGGTLRTEDWSRRRFMNLFGSPNSFHNALLCWIPTFNMETALSGWSPFETDLGTSKCVILWGFNPGASGMPGMHGYTDLQRAGLKLIVVDPRYSETASKADLWLPLRPGSDTALALAMLHTLIFEGMYDQEFVENWCTGWDELVDHMGQYSPEWAEEITWLPAEKIRVAARMYGMNKPGNIQWGCTADQLGTTSVAGAHARACMRAITGNLDVMGGDLMPGPAFGYVTDEEIEANDYLPEEQKAKQIGSNKFKLTSWPGYQIIADTAKETWGKAPTAEWMCEAHGPSVFKAIITGDPYQVRALIVSATNPVNSYGDSKMTLQALKSVEFLVTCDYWMTPAAFYSDYVMPIAMALERPTIHTNYGVTDSIVCSQRAIQPMYDRHTDYTFWRDLGLATGQDPEMWPWANEEEVFEYILSPLGMDMSYDEFVETIRMYYPPLHYKKHEQRGFMCTGTRKVELKSTILEELGYPALPTYIGCAENEIDNPELAQEYPIVLTTGGGFMPYHHSEQFQIQTVRYLYHDPYFTIHPDLAAQLGIDEGDWCWIETRRGRIKQRANVEPSVDPRVVYAQRGWWYPERGVDDPEAPFGCLESNVNVLTSVDDEHCDPIGGSWANRGLLCRVYPCSELDEGAKVDTTWSIPGSSSTPGVTVMPSDSKLAYEPIPFTPPEPDFEIPEGTFEPLAYNWKRNVAYVPSTGWVYDAESGWLIDEQENVYHDAWTGWAFDPDKNLLLDEATGTYYDMETREEVPFLAGIQLFPGAPAAPYQLPFGLMWDKDAGYAKKMGKNFEGLIFDPESQWLINPETMQYHDLKKGWIYDADSGLLYNPADGTWHDMETYDEVTFVGSVRAYPGAEAAPYEIPDGLVWDSERGVAVRPGTPDAIYDPDQQWLVNPDTGVFYDVVQGYAYDPDSGLLLDEATGSWYTLDYQPAQVAADVDTMTDAIAEAAADADEVADEVAAVADEAEGR